jgi:hypothetical protein
MTVVIAVFAASGTAALASPPAVDQYTQHLPSAGGGQGSAGDSAPVAQPDLLPSKTRDELDSSADGQLLTQIATAPALGAANPTGGAAAEAPRKLGSTSAVQGRGVAAVVSESAGAGPSLALLAALVAICAAGAWRRAKRTEL